MVRVDQVVYSRGNERRPLPVDTSDQDKTKSMWGAGRGKRSERGEGARAAVCFRS